MPFRHRLLRGLAAALTALLAHPAMAAQSLLPVRAFDEEGFALATPGVELAFPRDHGSHPRFKSEWWYVTGHLASADGSHAYGFQLTFFRAARQLDRDGGATEGEPAEPSELDQIYMAHAAVFDKSTGAFHHEERLNSDIWNADAAVGSLDLYNGNWYLRMTDPASERMAARFSLASLGSFSLSLAPLKPKTLFGEEGYSRKGEEPGAASYYITFTRLEAQVEAVVDGKAVELRGLAWMDHEFSSSQLSEGQIGWNWTSLILDDGSELMAYVMRREDGSVDPHSRLTLVDPQARKTVFASDAFSWTPRRYWTSSDSGGVYPVEYAISWQEGALRRRLVVKPFGDRQELLGSIGDFVYWEGASQAFDEDGEAVGLGYTELTGYAGSLFGRF